MPWETISPWVELLPSYRLCPPWVLRPDLFHNWHLGAGRYYISSALCVLLQFENEGQGGVDVRFAAMSSKWRQYCKDRHEPRHN